MKHTLKAILLLSVVVSPTSYSAEEASLGSSTRPALRAGVEKDIVGALPSFPRPSRSRASGRSGKSGRTTGSRSELSSEVKTLKTYLKACFIAGGMKCVISSDNVGVLKGMVRAGGIARERLAELEAIQQEKDERIAGLQALLEARSGLAEEEVKRRELESYERGRAEAIEELKLAEGAKRKAEGAKRVEGLKRAVAGAESVVASQMGSPAARMSAKMRRAAEENRELQQQNRRLSARAGALEAKLAEAEAENARLVKLLRKGPATKVGREREAVGFSSPATKAAGMDESVTKRRGGSRLVTEFAEPGTGSASDFLE